MLPYRVSIFFLKSIIDPEAINIISIIRNGEFKEDSSVNRRKSEEPTGIEKLSDPLNDISSRLTATITERTI